jgi:type IV secretion system protein VirB3
MRDTIFKGATRPAMMLGVPIMPFILVVGLDFLLAMWSLLLGSLFASFSFLMLGVVVVLVLRYISSQDDQRLNQYLLRFRDTAFRKNAGHWNAHSMSPIDFRKRQESSW